MKVESRAEHTQFGIDRLSFANVSTFVYSLVNGFTWQTFLIDKPFPGPRFRRQLLVPAAISNADGTRAVIENDKFPR